MSIEPEIKELFAKLDLTWFGKLKVEFAEHPFYNKNTQFIDDVIQEYAYVYDPETGEAIEDVYEVEIHATLPEYAWSGNGYGYDCPEDHERYFVLKAQTLSGKLIEIVDQLLREINDIKDKNKFLVTVVQFVIDSGNDLKREQDDALYHEVIDYCVQSCRHEISKKYRSIRVAHDTIASYEDKLYFDLSQKELAFFLAVLVRSGIIHGASDKKSTFQHFFSKYFYFKNQKAANSFQRAADINKQISDVYSSKNTDYQNIREEMKKRIIQAIQDL